MSQRTDTKLTLLDREILHTLMEAKVLVEGWRKEYNRFRPHVFLGYKPPAPEAYEAQAGNLYGSESIRIKHASGDSTAGEGR